MKLYTAKISPYAAMCRFQIYCKNLDVELLELPNDASWDDVRAVSPIQKIPVLVDGETVIPESTVICEYLEDCFPQVPLRPDNAAELARMRLLSRVADQYLLLPLLPLFAHLSRKRRDQAVVDAGLEKIDKGLVSLEYFLGSGDFAVGTAITLADCHLVPVLVFLEKYLPFFGVERPFEPYSKLSRYWNGIRENPEARKVIDEIHQGIAAKS